MPGPDNNPQDQVMIYIQLRRIIKTKIFIFLLQKAAEELTDDERAACCCLLCLAWLWACLCCCGCYGGRVDDVMDIALAVAEAVDVGEVEL